MNWAKVQKDNPPLPKAEQISLARKAKAGDAKARDRLVLSCVGLCMRFARRYQFLAPFDDIVHAGIEGTLHGLRTFDPDRGTMFANHAYAWIKQFSSRAVAREEQLVKDGSRSARGHIVITKKQSLNEVAYSHGQGQESVVTYLDLLRSTTELASETSERAEVAERVRARVERAVTTPFARDILNARLVNKGETLKEIGERHGYSREWVRQVENGLRKKLERVLKDLADAA